MMEMISELKQSLQAYATKMSDTIKAPKGAFIICAVTIGCTLLLRRPHLLQIQHLRNLPLKAYWPRW